MMHLLEPGGRKFVELGSGAPPVEEAVVLEEEEEEGADAAITPRPRAKVRTSGSQ